MKKLFLLLLLVSSIGFSQISLADYTQDFNTLSNGTASSTMPANWSFLETGSNANTTYSVGTGSSNSGDTWSLGAAGSTERCLGSIRSSNLLSSYGVYFKNNSGNSIQSVTISYTGEEWRLGTISRTDKLDFQYSLDATSLSTGSWTDINELDFTTPNTVTAGAKDGNATGNKTSLTYTFTFPSGLANGATVFFRWVDADATSSDDALGIDDFSISSVVAMPVELSSFTSKVVKSGVELNWATSTEISNYGFDVERSNDNANFTKIAFVKGSGNSNSVKNYSFVDNSVNNGKFQYRLKQVDNDGSFSYSEVVNVELNGQPSSYSLNQNYPNPFNPSTRISYSLPYESRVNLTVYNLIGEVVSEMNKVQQAGNYDFTFNASNLKSGVYLYKLSASSLDGKSSFANTKKMTLVK